MEKEEIKLNIYEFDWECPNCESINFVKCADAFDNLECNDVKCEECEKEFSAVFKN